MKRTKTWREALWGLWGYGFGVWEYACGCSVGVGARRSLWVGLDWVIALDKVISGTNVSHVYYLGILLLLVLLLCGGSFLFRSDSVT